MGFGSNCTALCHAESDVALRVQEMNGILAILASILMITDITFDEDPDIGGVYIRDEAMLEMGECRALRTRHDGEDVFEHSATSCHVEAMLHVVLVIHVHVATPISVGVT